MNVVYVCILYIGKPGGQMSGHVVVVVVVAVVLPPRGSRV